MNIMQKTPEKIPLRDIRLVILDLDGTMIDSVPDLDVALNGMLRDLNLPPVDVPSIRMFVGKGTQNLVRSTLSVYLDPVEGSDDNDGLTADTPVQTLERAKSLACGMPIIVSGTISVGNDETLVVEDVTLQRAQGFDGRLILVGMYGEVTVRDATIDGMGIDTGYSLIHTQGGTINIGDGAIICNNGYTAVTVVNNGDFVMTGGEIYGNFSEDDGGAVYIRKANADISGGSIHDNQTEKSGGAIALNSGRLTVGAVEIYGNVANGTHFGFSDENTSMVGGGAAIYAESNKQTDATLAVNGAVIHHNEAKGPGGAICIVDCHRNKDIDVSLTDV